MAFYTIEATNHVGVVRLMSPLTAHQAYKRTVELRRRGYTHIVAIDTRTRHRVTDVQRLLRDLKSCAKTEHIPTVNPG